LRKLLEPPGPGKKIRNPPGNNRNPPEKWQTNRNPLGNNMNPPGRRLFSLEKMSPPPKNFFNLLKKSKSILLSHIFDRFLPKLPVIYQEIT
jgi:hypothetical protein